MISIIIICKNEVANIIQSIEAALTQKSIENIEVIVVDGMSTDGTYELVEKTYKNNILLLKNTKMVAPAGMNLGIEAAKGDYILICGARSILSSNYVETCVDILRNSKSIKCVGGVIIQIGNNKIAHNISLAMSSTFGVGFSNFRTVTKSRFVDTVSVPVFPKQLFIELGNFDEDCIRNQDDEFSYRILKSNYKILITDKAHSAYIVRSSFATFFKQYFQYGFWKVFVNYKHHSITSTRQLIPPLFILLLFSSSVIHLKLFFILALAYLTIISGAATSKAFVKKGNALLIATGFLILHFSYGLGYLNGLLNIVILKRKLPNYIKSISR